MSKPSEDILTWRLSRVAKWLIIVTLCGYVLFLLLVLVDQTSLLGHIDSLNLVVVAMISGFLAVLASGLTFLVGAAGLISNIVKKTDLYLKLFFVSMLVILLAIPFNLFWLSLYGY